MNENILNIEIDVVLTDEDIDDIMVTALEGGICYWCGSAVVVGDYLGEYASDQISRGGELELIDCEDGTKFYLDKDKFINGFKKYIAEGNVECLDSELSLGAFNGRMTVDAGMIDADGADCIVQYGLFGELVYG